MRSPWMRSPWNPRTLRQYHPRRTRRQSSSTIETRMMMALCVSANTSRYEHPRRKRAKRRLCRLITHKPRVCWMHRGQARRPRCWLPQRQPLSRAVHGPRTSSAADNAVGHSHDVTSNNVDYIHAFTTRFQDRFRSGKSGCWSIRRQAWTRFDGGSGRWDCCREAFRASSTWIRSRMAPTARGSESR